MEQNSEWMNRNSTMTQMLVNLQRTVSAFGSCLIDFLELLYFSLILSPEVNFLGVVIAVHPVVQSKQRTVQ